MSARLSIILATVALALSALILLGCGDEEDTAPATSTTAPAVEDREQVAPPGAGSGAVPPQVVECLADRGYEVNSPADVHSAPPDVLQACFAH